MQQHDSNYLACRPPPLNPGDGVNRPPPPHAPDPRGMGSIGQKSTFSEHGHVAYQIKGNHDFTNMVGNILYAYPLPP